MLSIYCVYVTGLEECSASVYCQCCILCSVDMKSVQKLGQKMECLRAPRIMCVEIWEFSMCEVQYRLRKSYFYFSLAAIII